MKIIISCHCDTVFTQPYCKCRDGVLEGANDNFSSIMAISRTLDDPIWKGTEVELQLTEDEEMYMDGAKAIAKKNNPKDTLIIVMDVTDAKIRKGNFTVENVHEIKISEIKKALVSFVKRYRIVKNGSESEAWLYAENGFSVLEIDIPVSGGLHSLNSKSKTEDHAVVSKAILALIYYFKDKDISAIRSDD
jgi:hypothetical protein